MHGCVDLGESVYEQARHSWEWGCPCQRRIHGQALSSAGDRYRGQPQGKDSVVGVEVGTQKVRGEGSGEEFKDGKRLGGGQGGRGSRKKLKKADTPGRPGAHTGTEAARERGKGKKVENKSRRKFEFSRKENMSKGQGQRGEKGQTPATESQLAVVQEGARAMEGGWDHPITVALKEWAMKYFENKLRTKHGGRLKQEVGSGGSGDGNEGQKCAEADSGTKDARSRSHVGMGGPQEAEGRDRRGGVAPGAGESGHTLVQPA